MNKKVKKLIIKHLDKIYTGSVKLSKSFGLDSISLALLKQVISLNKMTADNTNKEIHDFIDNYNKMLDELYRSCVAVTKKVKSNHVSKLVLKQFIDTLKENLDLKETKN